MALTALLSSPWGLSRDAEFSGPRSEFCLLAPGSWLGFGFGFRLGLGLRLDFGLDFGLGFRLRVDFDLDFDLI